MWDPNKRGDVRRGFKVKGWAQRRKKSGSKGETMWDWAGAVLVFFGDESKSVSEMFWVFGLVRLVPAQMRRCLDASLPAVRWIWWSTEG